MGWKGTFFLFLKFLRSVWVLREVDQSKGSANFD